MEHLTSPRLVLHEQRCRQNIKAMCDKAKRLDLKFRPHFKTHQSQMIGEWFKEEGIDAITVSSIGMANYFAEAGWKEITIAFPVNIYWVDQLNTLSKKTELNILISDIEIVDRLDADLQFTVNAYIEIDSGSDRSGLKFHATEKIERLAGKIQKSNKINLKGCYSHAGHTYGARSKTEIEQIANEGLKNFTALRNVLSSHAGLEFCWGDTPSCSILENFEGIGAISAGNFVFYDVMQNNIGSCGLDQVAVALYCPVVSKKEESKELCIHGGAIHFSKDQVQVDGKTLFGQLVDENWQPVEGSHIRALSQEHGIVKVPDALFSKVNVGDFIIILPVHSCLTAQAMGMYYTNDGHNIDHYAQKSRPD